MQRKTLASSSSRSWNSRPRQCQKCHARILVQPDLTDTGCQDRGTHASIARVDGDLGKVGGKRVARSPKDSGSGQARLFMSSCQHRNCSKGLSSVPGEESTCLRCLLMIIEPLSVHLVIFRCVSPSTSFAWAPFFSLTQMSISSNR